MLVLSRAIGEVISIGDDIAVHILEVNGAHVKFGIQAPVDVNVHRAEVYQKILERQGSPTHPVPLPNP
ncbi:MULTISPECIES: carbon storage regulator CsrA [Pseudomonas]|uniref:Translational regulator CsrA n=1 Tax=Pseudomonas haemolytica TaxID=2600065 RepID=A0A5P1D9Q4_9PSED|nr:MULTISPECIES: carbon storage regulator CsrA [Pseudomonas]MBJ2245360.1 carbon storage regulator CsrA [Pseudomonas haemolytica]MBJ2272722.1 carbon storage regulator CsrA [Pseudomonas haemolytica]MBJ2286241.1 carbon storage regulator CsrA [Pseudomonas sp. MF6755]MBK3447032.1 carbon storage regulator CsrA [Pseudomonas haemolytica]MBK3458528.1 carbon storage regulator CsrA [Pseudomonas haemolytica]